MENITFKVNQNVRINLDGNIWKKGVVESVNKKIINVVIYYPTQTKRFTINLTKTINKIFPL